jgi:hypothetical protein
MASCPAGRLPNASTRPVEAATRNRLVGERTTGETADAWIAAWEAQAAQDGLERGSAFWQAAVGVDRRAAAASGPT